MELKTKDDVCRALHISARGLEKMVAEGRFPVPVRIGKRALWMDGVVEGWLARQLAAQEGWNRRP